MRRWNKLLSLILAISLVLSLTLPVGAVADAASGGTCGENLTWSLDDAGKLTIDGEGEMTNYTFGGAPWYSNRKLIQSLEIGGGVTSIGNYAFYDCADMTVAAIPDGVMSIGEYAFALCGSLTDLEIPGSATDIGECAFFLCVGLTDAVISDGVETIGALAFFRCNSLDSITIPASVTQIGERAFSECASLTEIVVDGENPEFSSVDGVLFSKTGEDLYTYPGNGPAEYEMPDGVKRVGSYAFSGCGALTAVTFAYSVTDIGEYAFSDCGALESIAIPELVEEIGAHAFRNCSSLSSVTILDNVKTIWTGAFSGCAVSDVYYSGTQEKWNQITNNDQLYTAEIHFESAIPHTPELFPADPHTCTEDGSKAYYICLACGKLFWDAACKQEFSDLAETVDPAAHTPGEPVEENRVEPTCTEPGVLTHTCSHDASHTYTETIDALGHKWDNGTVTKQPTATEKVRPCR